MTDILHGETVTIVSWSSVQRGYYTEYDARFQFDNPDGGAPITRSIKFNEAVAKTMREAGYDVNYKTSYAVNEAHISVILDGTGDKLRISHVYGTDDKTSFEVPDTRRKHTEAKVQLSEDEIKEYWSNRRNPKRETPVTPSIPTADSDIFAHGERMIREHLAALRAEKAAPIVYTLRLGHWMRGVA